MSNEWSKEWPKPIADQTGITKESLDIKPVDPQLIEDYKMSDPALPTELLAKQPWPEAWVDASIYGKGFTKDGKHIPLSDVIISIDIATKPDKLAAIIGYVKDGDLIITGYHEGDEARAIIETYNNKAPTHDPYTNPDMHIYHECACGAILDPNTKSFATLNSAASYVGWKIRWGHDTYKAYCKSCGEGVE